MARDRPAGKANVAQRLRARRGRAVAGTLLAVLASLTASSAAAAATTIGQLAPPDSPKVCTISPRDALQPTVTSGNTYVVPPGGVAITSWSTNAAPGAGQMLEMKVFRKVAEPGTYRVVGHDGPRSLTGGVLNTFPVNIAVLPWDVLGFNDVNASSANSACIFSAPGDTNFARDGDLADGASGDFTPVDTDYRNNIAAVVGFKPSNSFSLGKVEQHRGNGTATIPVEIPGPGSISLAGRGVKAKRGGPEAAASMVVTHAGTVKLRIKAKGKARRRLNHAGRTKVTAKITYTPNGTAAGDVVGDPKTRTKRVKLIKEQ
jgi:hypothetical protein